MDTIEKRYLKIHTSAASKRYFEHNTNWSVVRLLNLFQKHDRSDVAKEMFTLDNNVIDVIIAGGETWVYE